MTGTQRLLPFRPLAVTACERRWVFGFAAVVMAVTMLPYLLGYAVQGTDWRFSGFVFGVEDGNSYIAKMLSGTAGAWLFRTPYTAYPQRGALIFLPYILLGKLAAPPGLHEQLVALYHLFRIGAGVLAVMATYDFIAFFVEKVGIRQLGLALATLGGGLGWLLLLLGKEGWLGSLPLEFYSPESFGFLGLYGIPHLALARALLLWSLLAYLEGTIRVERRIPAVNPIIKTMILWLLAGLTQPLLIGVIGAVFGMHLVSTAILQIFRRIPVDWEIWRRWVRFVAISAILPGLFVVYYLWSLATDPFLISWTQQNLIQSPHPLHYLFAYGLILPVAFAGGQRLLSTIPRQGLLPIAWVLALPFLAYAPLGLQRRLPEGIWVALVVLAMVWMEDWKTRKSERDSIRLFQPSSIRLAVIPISLFFFSTLLLLAGGLMSASHQDQPVFTQTTEVDVFEILREDAEPGAVVMAAYQTGNALPAWAPLRVLIGHGPESANLASLLPEVDGFYTQGTADTDRLDLIRRFDVRYVFWGPAERDLGDWDPGRAPYLEFLHRSGDYSVYKVIAAP